LNTSSQTLREYIWLNDMRVAVVDNVNTAPVIYYVQVDHLMRPARMTDGSANWVWDVIFDAFGATAYVNENPTVIDIRFPGQWFQLEMGLAYNWHRHYDATTGRYVQPDSVGLTALLVDGPSVYNYARQAPLGRTDYSGLFIPASLSPDKPPPGDYVCPIANADDPQGLKIARDAANAAGLNREQRRIFHDLITGQDITDYQELLRIAQSVKAGTY
jgi:RHS repeat-associated protein